MGDRTGTEEEEEEEEEMQRCHLPATSWPATDTNHRILIQWVSNPARIGSNCQRVNVNVNVK